MPRASSPSPASTITLQPVAGQPPPEPAEQERELERLRADNIHLSKNVEQAGIEGAPGRMFLALVLLSIIVGVLLSVAWHRDVSAWVHQLSYSLRVDRVGMLPPPDAR
jgi:hypothetical protein